MGAMAVAGGFRICQLEVAHRPRTRGQSKYGLSVFWWKPLIDMVGVYWLSRRRFPCHIEERADREDNSPNRQNPGLDRVRS
ncbi:MAG TPA: hypothetical protein VIS71_05970, partial [Terrimicrobium sp.]